MKPKTIKEIIQEWIMVNELNVDDGDVQTLVESINDHILTEMRNILL